jgi:hypothetical protein
MPTVEAIEFRSDLVLRAGANRMTDHELSEDVVAMPHILGRCYVRKYGDQRRNYI